MPVSYQEWGPVKTKRWSISSLPPEFKEWQQTHAVSHNSIKFFSCSHSCLRSPRGQDLLLLGLHVGRHTGPRPSAAPWPCLCLTSHRPLFHCRPDLVHTPSFFLCLGFYSRNFSCIVSHPHTISCGNYCYCSLLLSSLFPFCKWDECTWPNSLCLEVKEAGLFDFENSFLNH